MRIIPMARGRVVKILAGLVVLSLTMGVQAARAGYAHFVVDVTTGTVLAAENSDVINHPASLTKMMTLYLAFEAMRAGRLSWEQDIMMTPNAAEKIPYKLGIGAGKTLTVREAVNATAIRSANDAAQAIGDHLGGNEENFGRLMTAKAKALGMTRTVFRNASGLPDDAQVTTARDMAVLAAALIRDYPEEYRSFSARSFNFRGRTIRGHNNLMYRYAGMDGVKTGYVTASGFNLVSAVNDNGRRIIGVVLGGKTARSRDAQMEALLDRALGRGEALVAGASSVSTVSGVPMPIDRPATSQVLEQTARADVSSRSSPRMGSALPGVAPPASIPTLALTGQKRSQAQAQIDVVAPATPSLAMERGADPVGWRVQIAAAGSRSAASQMLTRAQAILSDRFGSVAPWIDEGRRNGSSMFRAQLIGFGDRKGALDACSALRQKSVDCFVLQGAS